MISMKKRFENKAKIRINLMGSSDSRKSALVFNLGKRGVFTNQNTTPNNVFSTEVLYSSPKNNFVKVYLDFKKKSQVLLEVRKSILHLIDEAFMDQLKETETKELKSKFNDSFMKANKNNVFYSNMSSFRDMKRIFKEIDFNKLFDDLSKINKGDNIEEKDELIWKSYFSDFEDSMSSMYDEFMNQILKYYTHDEDGCIYENTGEDDGSFYNENLRNLEKISYDERSICGFIIKRAYIEVPALRKEFENSVFIDYNSRNLNHNTACDIADIVSEDYKSLFVIFTDCDNASSYLSSINDSVNRITMEKRIFCILDMDNICSQNMSSSKGDAIKAVRDKASKLLGIRENRVIVTKQLMDIDKDTLKQLSTNNSFMKLYKIMKMQGMKLTRPIKIKNPHLDNIIVNVKK